MSRTHGQGWLNTSRKPAPTSWPSPPSPTSDSTMRSATAPTPSISSPTGHRSSDSSARPSRTTRRMGRRTPLARTRRPRPHPNRQHDPRQRSDHRSSHPPSLTSTPNRRINPVHHPNRLDRRRRPVILRPSSTPADAPNCRVPPERLSRPIRPARGRKRARRRQLRRAPGLHAGIPKSAQAPSQEQ